GTLILVSHDRWFVSQLATRVVEVRPDGLRDFPGTYEEYVRACGDDHLDADVVLEKARRDGAEARRKEGGRGGRGSGGGGRGERGGSVALLCRPGCSRETPREEVAALEGERARLQSKIDRLMEAWEVVELELEAAR